jgi:hypothetical protein
MLLFVDKLGFKVQERSATAAGAPEMRLPLLHPAVGLQLPKDRATQMLQVSGQMSRETATTQQCLVLWCVACPCIAVATAVGPQLLQNMQLMLIIIKLPDQAIASTCLKMHNNGSGRYPLGNQAVCMSNLAYRPHT